MTSTEQPSSALVLAPVRPTFHEDDGNISLVIGRCVRCRFAIATLMAQCPKCGGVLEVVAVAAAGVIWSKTVVRVSAPGREPPYGLAYVDIDDGPRMLARFDAVAAAAIGDRVVLVPDTYGLAVVKSPSA